MRLLTFKAANLRQAMTLVRRELGDEATIVSTQTNPISGEARIVAARQQDASDPRLGHVAMAPEQRFDQVLETLLLHGVPMNLADRLSQAAADMEPRTPIAALTGTLALDFNFVPVDVTADNQRLILVGPPGAGKTLALVKLAARALMARRSVQLLTTDLKRAGAVEQLTAFAKVMGQELFITETAEELAQFMARIPKRTVVLIDSPGVNHRSHTEMGGLFDFVNAGAGSERGHGRAGSRGRGHGVRVTRHQTYAGHPHGRHRPHGGNPGSHGKRRTGPGRNHRIRRSHRRFLPDRRTRPGGPAVR